MKDVQFRSVSHLGKGDTFKVELFAKYAGQEEFKMMEVAYTKVAASGEKKK